MTRYVPLNDAQCLVAGEPGGKGLVGAMEDAAVEGVVVNADDIQAALSFIGGDDPEYPCRICGPGKCQHCAETDELRARLLAALDAS